MKKQHFIHPEIKVEDLSRALFKANQKLEQKNKELIQSQKEKNEIVANISHDLRAPITAINNIIEYLNSMEEWNREEVSELFGSIQKRSNYLNHLINDVFLFSTITSNSYPMKREIVRIDYLLEEFFYEMSSDPKFHDREMSIDLKKEFSVEVNIDVNMIVRVLSNIFTNARKYSDEGSQIKLTATTFSEQFVKISIMDTGYGIAEENLRKVFMHTFKEEYARTPNESDGCGMGLSIARSIVEAHGGEIWCQRNEKKGSTFTFLIPIAQNKQ